MRRFLYAIFLLLAVGIAISQFAEFKHIVDTLRLGLWYWLAMAVAVQAVYLMNLAAAYRAAFRIVGIEEKLSRLFPLVIAANFVNVVTASGGIAGMAIFAADARRRGLSATRVTIGGVLFVLSDFAAFLCVLAVGLVVLFRRNDLRAGDLVAAGVIVVAAAGLGWLLLLGLRSAQELERALIWATRPINWLARPFLHRAYLSETTAHDFATDTAEAFAAMRRQPRNHWLLPFALALCAKALLISILFLVFLAFRQAFSVGTLIAGFSLAYLFLIVSPTPSGIGIVEGVMTLALRSLRVPLGAAAVITLAYRGLTFWLPFLYGFVALRWLGRRPEARKAAPQWDRL